MLLRDSAYKGETTWAGVAEWAQEGRGKDTNGYRAEFLTLIEKARSLTGQPK
jgi:Ca-activated chloride channel family protein